MLRLSKKADYAIILLSHLGEASGPVSAQEMASNYHLPQPMIANILKQLAASKLVESTRGVQGGYLLHCKANDSRTNLAQCSTRSGHTRILPLPTHALSSKSRRCRTAGTD